MKYTQVAADAFEKLQLNAGILLTEFDPATGSFERENIFAATSGGVSFTAAPEYSDFGEDIDNVPNNTLELKRQDSVTATMSGTALTADTATAKALIGAADVDAQGKITPRTDLTRSDFSDIWWVGDYSDVNNGAEAGFMAIRLINALNTSGFSMQTGDKSKGNFAFEFTGHYSMEDITVVPYEIYIKKGGEQETGDATLSALAIGALTLDPEFSPTTYAYTATTTNATNTVTATPTASTATVEMTLNSEAMSGTTATWDEGENVLEITVVDGDARNGYTVTVTKE